MTTPIKAKQGKASKKAEPKYVNKNVGLITLVELLNNHANPIPPESPMVEDSGTINAESLKVEDSQIEEMEISLPDQLALKPGPDRQTLMWAPCRHH